MEFKTVGVVGAGVMGRGVAQNLAQTGHSVVLVDIADDILESARAEIKNSVRGTALMRGERVDVDEILGRISFTRAPSDLASSEFVVENTTEDWEVKREVYRMIDSIVPPSVVFAANTSAISITRIASATGRPDRVVGMHFMNPVPMKPTVEVIRGHHTSAESLGGAERFLEQMGKKCVIVEDMPGFVSNRVLMLTVNEAIFLVQDRVASAEDVDRVFRECFSHKMGPLETADLIGLDTILKSVEVLYESYNDDKYRPAPLLKKMVAAGLHGRKSGKGFYAY